LKGFKVMALRVSSEILPFRDWKEGPEGLLRLSTTNKVGVNMYECRVVEETCPALPELLLLHMSVCKSSSEGVGPKCELCDM
jgi:hypothetical protein